MKLTKQTVVDVKKFWKRFQGLSENDCWEFNGARCTAGYGQVWIYPKVVYAHRVAWILTHGAIPKGMFVCHKCDNPPCCNPKHLFLGTHKDNMEDSKNKGRNNHGPIMYGVSHPLSKLTEEDVSDIRRLYVRGIPGKRSETSINGLAASYGVASSLIHRIVKGVSWPHAQPGTEMKDKVLDTEVRNGNV
jgi:hypothetical protein